MGQLKGKGRNMPTKPTYPGVYIEEMPSEVRTITGVATSITAFIGRAKRGPLNEPVTVNSYADFSRVFGGLWQHSGLGYAVRDFFLNGGSQAIVVRLFKQKNAKHTTKIKVTSPAADKPMNLVATSQGEWGQSIRVRVDYNVLEDVYKDRYGLGDTDMFNLTIHDMSTGITEFIRNVTCQPDHVRSVNKVLAAESQLVCMDGNPLGARPDKSPDVSTGDDPWTDDRSTKGTDGNDGDVLDRDSYVAPDLRDKKEGIYALEDADIFNILCIPLRDEYNDTAKNLFEVWDPAAKYCEEKRAILLVDPQKECGKEGAKTHVNDKLPRNKNAAFFFPRLNQGDPLLENQVDEFAPCGAVAGVFARTDAQRGVWKAPAGLDTTLIGVPDLSVKLTDAEVGELNPLGVNCLRTMPAAGRVIWGSRTLRGDDRLADQWKYIPVRRTALFIEESLFRGLQWVVFEPNDEPLWAQIRLNVGAFMYSLYRQGAFQGKKSEAYFVKCDKETTTQNDINNGIVNILVGFAPLKPAEFVIIKLSQIAGQVQT